ncbi:cytochrome P450 [Sciscionella marina]|uniref:cytochrome P450 n=1 Tax=Sciscionella marina TaxID=508770 RepID=UPI0012F62B8D|nr:cytochrome P450 [Sciscionella marina]
MTTFTDSQIPPALSDVDPELHHALTGGEIASTADPYPLYRKLRGDYPVADISGAVWVFRYDDVATVLQHPDMSTDDRNSAAHQTQQAQGALSAPYLAQLDDQSFLHRDPPEHTRLRKLVAKGFTPRRVEALRGFIQRFVEDVLDEAIRRGGLDVVAELAYPLPIAVICELIGIPDTDRAFVASWPRTQLCCSFESGSLKAAAELDQAGGESRQVEADRLQQQLRDYFGWLIDHRRDNPGKDLVSALLAAEADGGQLSIEEINATLRLLFVAGYENAVNLLGHGTLALLRHPDQWVALRDDPTLAAGAVDEVLRYDAPFQFTRRVALTDVDLGGYRITRGRHVLAFIAAANRDPAHFDDPDRFDIHRTGTRHLAFGSGIHACLGGPLARMQAEITFTTLTQRLVNPRLAADPPRYRPDVFRSLESLSINLSRTPAAA